MSRKILVASYASHITTLSFDASASPPSLTVVSTVEAGHHPSWIAPHTTDKSLVFTFNEQADGTAKTLKYDLSTGKGRIVGEASSGGADPCHAAVLGDALIIANVSTSTSFWNDASAQSIWP
jgi:6-phosphogluconolactonase (cycloisomerase 2 family)